MINLESVKSILQMEPVTVNNQKFDCIKDPEALVQLLNDLRVNGMYPSDKNEIAAFLIIAINSLFYKHAVLKEPVNTFSIISSLAHLVETDEKLFKTNKHYQNLVVCALACMEKNTKSFNMTIERLLPDTITNSSLAFNLACMSNVHGIKSKALQYTDLALKLNYNKNEILTDPQLKSMQDDPAFNAIINKSRLLSGERLTVEKMVQVIDYVAGEGLKEKETGDNLIYYVAEYLMDKNNSQNEHLHLLKTWLGASDRIPASPDRKQYLAQFAFGIIDGNPELVDTIESRLLDSEMTDYSYYINIAERLAAMNMPDKAYTYTDMAMSDRADSSYLKYRESLDKLYKINDAFRSMVDAHDLQKKELKEYLLEEPDPCSFNEVFHAAEIEFSSIQSYNRSERITAIAAFKDEPFRAQVEAFLRTGFDRLRKQIKKKDALINDVMFDALAVAIAEWQDPSFIDMLINEFAYVTDENESDGITRHYELNLTAGTIAVALAALGYSGSTAIFEPFLDSWEWRYRGEPFIMKVRYAKWIIEKKIDGALSYIKNEKNKSGLGYAICAIADLDAKDVLPYLDELKESITNSVTYEIIREAITRLNTQNNAPAWPECMIRMFGTATPSAMANGADNDNIFVSRARAARDDDKPGIVYEADDSAGDDR